MQVRGEGGSVKKRTNIVLVTSPFFKNTFNGEGGVKYLAYLIVRTLLMGPSGIFPLRGVISSIKACQDFREDLNHENWHKFLSSFRLSFS